MLTQPKGNCEPHCAACCSLPWCACCHRQLLECHRGGYQAKRTEVCIAQLAVTDAYVTITAKGVVRTAQSLTTLPSLLSMAAARLSLLRLPCASRHRSSQRPVLLATALLELPRAADAGLLEPRPHAIKERSALIRSKELGHVASVQHATDVLKDTW